MDHRIDGLLTFTGSGDRFYEDAVANGIPVVRVDRSHDSQLFDSVCIDHYRVVQEAMLNLTVSGFTRIAMFSSVRSLRPFSTVNLRKQSYRDYILTNCKDSYPIEYTVDTHDMESVRSCVQEFISRYPNDRKAIFAASMDTLTPLDWTCRLLGLHYPNDIALMGYAIEGDMTAASAKLTVISQPINGMCSRALKLLTDAIENNEKHDPVHEFVSANLIVRESTVPLLPGSGS